jgi:hypothetical protein
VALDSQPLHGWLLDAGVQVEALADDDAGLADSSGRAALCLGPETAARARALGCRDVVELPGAASVETIAAALRVLHLRCVGGESAMLSTRAG